MQNPASVVSSLLSAPVPLTRCSNFQAFDMFPISGSKSRRLASLLRLLQGGVRRFLRYYQGALTSCVSSRRVSFPSLGDTPCCAIALSGRSHSLSDSLWSPGLFRDSTGKTHDLPSSRESSIVRSLLFQRPRPDHPFQTFTKKVDVAPGEVTTEAPTIKKISWLNSKAFELAVYASQHLSTAVFFFR